MQTKLYVIKQVGRPLYWNCSSEHGCGWNPDSPKQSFSPSELTKEIRRMIDDGHFADVEILELRLTNLNNLMCEASMPQGMESKRDRCPACGRR